MTLIQLKESDRLYINEACGKEYTKMVELLEDKDYLVLEKSARGVCMQARGCVGFLSFYDGTRVNLLPNVSEVRSDDGSANMLMEMLYSIFGIGTRNGMTENLFEFFIKVFADSVSRLIRCGLRSKYHLVSGNEKAFKGRIVFNEHIRQNFIHKERIYVEYETYSQNRPENRLIKTTLETLSRISTDSSNLKRLKTLVMEMEEIPMSVDVDRDLSMVIVDRNMVDYIPSLFWCNLFLKGMGLAGASRDNLSYAMIIDTQSVYSAYVAKMSTNERIDGMYQVKYNAEVINKGDSKDTSVILVDLSWNFYDREKDRNINDAELLYVSAPGYRAIPAANNNRLRSMAGSYLSDVLA